MLNVITGSPDYAGDAVVVTESVTNLYTAIHKTMPELQEEHKELVRQRQEHLDCFGAAAFDFAAKTRSGKKRRELTRAIRALQRIDEAIDATARDIRNFAEAERAKPEIDRRHARMSDVALTVTAPEMPKGATA